MELFAVIFYGIPAAALVLFAVSLFLFCHGRHRNKISPGTVSEEKMRVRKILLIVSAGIAGVLLTVLLGLAVLLMMAVAFM